MIYCYDRKLKNIKLLSIGGLYVDINSQDFHFKNAGLAVETELVVEAHLPNFASVEALMKS